jgi:hypothetical protein
MKHPFHQTRLYEIHSRIFCSENQCRIDDLATDFWEEPAVLAADEIWLMGIWAMSPGSRKIAQAHPGLRSEFKKALHDVKEEDVLSSPYAIYEYSLNPSIASVSGLQKFRDRLHIQNKKLILDFVPNHMALDTPLLQSHGECFVQGAIIDKNHFLHTSNVIFAHGRDPYFDGWTDTVQWDFSNPKTLELHIQILLTIAEHCDGVRCDMAMLALPDVFHSTHGKPGIAYWDKLIYAVKVRYPHFKFYAEAYWNREYDLQVLGFDGTYDKTLYDRYSHFNGPSLCDHLRADLSYQEKSIRFIENHDEDRAYSHLGENSKYAFGLLSFLPGILLYYRGQEMGNKIKLPVQLGKRDIEPPVSEINAYYARAFSILRKRITPINRTELTYQLYTEGQMLAYLLKYDTQFELFLWNPMTYEISGKLHLDMDIIFKNEFKDQISGLIFPKPNGADLHEGLYFKLATGQAQWFIS